MCVTILLLGLAANMFMNNILIIAKKTLNLTHLRIEIYPVEGPMLKVPVAPFPLMESLKSTDYNWYRKMYAVPSLERPRGSRRSRSDEEKAPLERRCNVPKKMASSRRGALQKPGSI